MVVAIAWASIGCAGSSKGMSEPSAPRAACRECANHGEPEPVATYAAVDVFTGWAGECWELYDSAGNACTEALMPTPGSPCRERKYACKQVAHELTITCAGGACAAASPAPFRGDWSTTYEQTRAVTITKPGKTALEVTFTPASGAKKVERLEVVAHTPERAEAWCQGSEPNTVAVALSRKEGALGGAYLGLTMTLPGVCPCARLPADQQFPNRYRCPGDVASGARVELRQPDFSATVPVACAAR